METYQALTNKITQMQQADSQLDRQLVSQGVSQLGRYVGRQIVVRKLVSQGVSQLGSVSSVIGIRENIISLTMQ